MSHVPWLIPCIKILSAMLQALPTTTIAIVYRATIWITNKVKRVHTHIQYTEYTVLLITCIYSKLFNIQTKLLWLLWKGRYKINFTVKFSSHLQCKCKLFYHILFIISLILHIFSSILCACNIFSFVFLYMCSVMTSYVKIRTHVHTNVEVLKWNYNMGRFSVPLKQ